MLKIKCIPRLKIFVIILYPALKNNEERIRDNIANELKEVIRDARR